MTPGQIVSQTARDHGVTVADMLSKGRTDPLVMARRDACHRLRRWTDLSSPEIARLLGFADHTTVLAAVAHPQPEPPNVPSERGKGGTCDVEGCRRKAKSLGLCNPHYQRWRRGTIHAQPAGTLPRRDDVPVDGVEHGTAAGYRQGGCGCEDCRKAHKVALARWRSSGPTTVGAGKVVEHLRWLESLGMARTEMGRRAGVSGPTVSRLLTGRQTRVKRDTAEVLLGVVPSCEVCGGESLAGTRWCGVGRCEVSVPRGRWSWSRSVA